VTDSTRGDHRVGRAPAARAVAVASLVERVLLASPRGFCAGVSRAIAVADRALELHGPPVYIRKQIVHNVHVVAALEARGAVFVDSEEEVPREATVVFSAHGVSPAIYAKAERRRLEAIDATCPLVTKVHSEVRHFAATGYTILVIGHLGHEEIDGTMGVAPGQTILVESIEDAETVEPPDPYRLAYATQTTLSLDDTAAIVAVLRRRFPSIVAPRREDICYATSNRQQAVKALLDDIAFLLVVGSLNSSNSNRLVELARGAGVRAELVDDAGGIDESWFAGVTTVGLTAGASVPEQLVADVCDWFEERGAVIEERAFTQEEVEFRLPLAVR